MGKAKDQAGNIWETDAQGNAVRLIQPAQQSPMSNPFMDPRLPSQVVTAQGQAAAAPYEAPKARADLTRTQQDIQAFPVDIANKQANIDQSRASIQNQRAQRLQGIRQEFNALPEVKTYSDAIASLGGALKAPDTPQGDLSIVYSFAKAMDPGSVVREGEMDMANQTASQTQQLQQYINSIQAGKRLPPAVRTGLVETMRQRVAAMGRTYYQQRARYEQVAKDQGFDPAEVVGKPLYDAVRPLEEQYIRAHGGTPKINGVPIDAASGPQSSAATGDFRNEYDPAFSAQMNKLIRSGAPYSQATGLAEQAGFNPIDQGQYAEAVKYARQHPEYKGSLAEATRTVPTTGFQRFAASPVGAAMVGFGKGATAGFGDEITAGLMPGDYRVNRDALAAKANLLAQENPTADLAGQIAGGAAAGYGGSAALAKVPGLTGGMFGAKVLPNVLSKEGVAGDALYGSAYGAGTDNDNRLQGALTGGALGIAGGAAARGGIGTLASAISPTGGKLAPLYAMGVRPSIGQRVGGVVNNLEEKLQSLPIIGDAIKGTRDRARDQFQVGLFNDSLGDIGQSLPAGMGVGHEPHAFAQSAFNNAYDAAKSNMTAVADAPFGQDIGGLQQTVGSLRPESQQQFAKLWTGSVARRMQDGVLSGAAFKDATSELEKKIAAIRNSKTGDGELADALQQASDALKGSAMRNSPPEAVAAMNAADKGYAKLVRIEEASRKAGGEPAEFSPSQYNTAVKTASGGTRNREYLRGDALNTDIAALGTRLGDKVSNSGTVDRYAPLAIASGMGYIEPMSAAGLAAYGALNAPGVRNVVTGAMAPRANPLFDRAAEQLRQRARIAGMFGAPVALDYYAAQ